MKEITIRPEIDAKIIRSYNRFDKSMSDFRIVDIKLNDLIHTEYYKVKIPYNGEILEGQFIYDNEYNHNQLLLDGALIILDE